MKRVAGTSSDNVESRSVIFSERLIELAKQIKALGFTWEPVPGHYVLDPNGIVERASPFQPGVYFILNLPHFERLAGGPAALQEKLIWLPTYEQARILLRQLGVSDAEQQDILLAENAIAGNDELEVLYSLILSRR